VFILEIGATHNTKKKIKCGWWREGGEEESKEKIYEYSISK